MTIDPVTMARFLVMPGADRLLDAFSRIPPGPLREATIAQVRAMADTYSGAPAEMRMPDPLLTAARAPQAPALEGPRRRGTPKNDEEKIIDLRMQGKFVPEIMQAVPNVPRQQIENIIRSATRRGVPFPKLPRKPPLEFNLARRAGHDIPLRVDYKDAKFRPVEAPDPVSGTTLAARGDGEALERPEEPQRPVAVHGGRRAFPPFGWDGRGDRQMLAAASRRGLTIHAYEELRESIVRHRLAGKRMAEIVEATGETHNSVKNIIDHARDHGVVFPKQRRTPETVIEGEEAPPKPKAH